MSRGILLGAVASLMLICSLPVVAQDKGYWRAVSSNAISITGDLSISDAKIAINFVNFPLAQIRRLQPAESSAAFDADPGEGGVGFSTA